MNIGRQLTFLASCFLLTSAFAQTPETWPIKSINMVVPFPPGGVADTVGRPVADALPESWVSR
jgi:tripartite-type tricarboxylate transporter receptor subunit TctC